MRAVLTDRLVWCALVCALALRLWLAGVQPYLPDESERSIPLADSITATAHVSGLPLRGPEHPALPSYVIAASQAAFGTSPLGQRMLHFWMGVLMIVVAGAIAYEWRGMAVARWTTWLLAFNEYHIGISAYATAKGPHLLAVALSLWAFSRALTHHRPRDLWLATAWVGVAFYAKEYAALLLPIYAVLLWTPRMRGTFRVSHQIVAVLLFGLLIAPDVIWHLLPRGDDPRWTYRDHLARLGSIGFTPGYLLFYLRDVIQSTHLAVTGQLIADGAQENPSMNSMLGALLLAGVVWSTRRWRGDITQQLWLLSFWSILCFFVVLAPSKEGLTPYAWYWVDMTLFPATLCAAHWMASTTGSVRRVVWLLAIVAMAYAVYNATFGGFVFEVPDVIDGPP